MGMKMSIDARVVKNFSPDFLIGELRRVGNDAAHGVSDVLRSEGHKIHELAVDYAPLDEGYLEKAIRYEESIGDRNRLEVRVYVDITAPGSNGRSVGDYAFYMHELLEPYGGPGNPRMIVGRTRPLGGSAIKQYAGMKVGGKFLERAFRDRMSSIKQRSEGIVRRIVERENAKTRAQRARRRR